MNDNLKDEQEYPRERSIIDKVIAEFAEKFKSGAQKIAQEILIALLIQIVSLAIKFGPDFVEMIKKIFLHFATQNWTTEMIQGLVAHIKPPDEY